MVGSWLDSAISRPIVSTKVVWNETVGGVKDKSVQ